MAETIGSVHDSPTRRGATRPLIAWPVTLNLIDFFDAISSHSISWSVAAGRARQSVSSDRRLG